MSTSKGGRAGVPSERPVVSPASQRPSRTSGRPGRPSEGPNRRVHARYAVDLQVTLQSEHNFYAGLVENLSTGGVFVATHSVRPVGERMELVIRVDGYDAPVKGTGVVRWIREFSETSDLPPGMGISFLDLEPGAEEVIAEFQKGREPLLYDD